MSNTTEEIVENMYKNSKNPEYGMQTWLGTSTRVNAIARMDKQHGDTLSIMKEYLLMEIRNREEQTSDEYSAYKNGINDFLNLFSTASDEVVRRNLLLKEGLENSEEIA